MKRSDHVSGQDIKEIARLLSLIAESQQKLVALKRLEIKLENEPHISNCREFLSLTEYEKMILKEK